MKKITVNQEGNKLVLERVFDAPQAVVFKAFTDGDILKQWWSPSGWITSKSEMDFLENGKWFYCMKCVDEEQTEFFGQLSCGVTTFIKVDAPHSYTSTDAFSDENGNVDEDMPITKNENTFTELGGNQTKLVNTVTVDDEDQIKQLIDMGMIEGVEETWIKLDKVLENL